MNLPHFLLPLLYVFVCMSVCVCVCVRARELLQVSQLLLEFLHKYVAEVVSDASVYQEHAGKPEVDIDDLRLAIQVFVHARLNLPPVHQYVVCPCLHLCLVSAGPNVCTSHLTFHTTLPVSSCSIPFASSSLSLSPSETQHNILPKASVSPHTHTHTYTQRPR